MAKPWAKLDFDWFEADGVVALRGMLGVRGELAYARLMGIWADFDGRIDLSAPGARLVLERKLESKGAKLDALLEAMSECGLLSAEMLGMGIVTSNRAAKDAQERTGRMARARKASDAAAEKRARTEGCDRQGEP